MSHPIENIMRTTMEQLKAMVDVNTIIGDPMVGSDGTMILPVSRVSLGFLSGGGEYGKGESIVRRNENVEMVDDIRHPFAGTSAAGMSLTPIAFLVVNGSNVRAIPASADCTVDRIVEIIPQMIIECKQMLKEKRANKGEGCCGSHDEE